MTQLQVLLTWRSGLAWTFVAIFFSLAAFNFYRAVHPSLNDTICGSHGTTWTPITQGLDYEWKMFPWLELFTKSDYFGDPIEEADKNWQAFLPESPIAIPKSRLSDLKITLDEGFLHVPRDESHLLAIPEVYVELACVNLLRQHLNRRRYNVTYSSNPAFKGSNENIMHRADLCLNRLREAAMCWGDLSTILQILTRVQGQSLPGSALDFSTKHKCRDFDAMTSWVQDNAVQAIRMTDMWWGGRVFY